MTEVDELRKQIELALDEMEGSQIANRLLEDVKRIAFNVDVDVEDTSGGFFLAWHPVYVASWFYDRLRLPYVNRLLNLTETKLSASIRLHWLAVKIGQGRA